MEAEPIAEEQKLEDKTPPQDAGKYKKQWYRYLIELGVVSFGVLFGFMLNNWRENAIQNERLKSLLLEVAAENDRNLVHLQFIKQLESMATPPIDSLVKAFRRQTPPEQSVFLHWFSLPMEPSTLDLTSMDNFLQETAPDEDIDLLKKRFTRTKAAFDGVHESFNYRTQIGMSTFQDMRKIVDVWYEVDSSWNYIPQSRIDMPALHASPSFLGNLLILQRNYRGRSDQLDEMIYYVNEWKDLLEQYFEQENIAFSFVSRRVDEEYAKLLVGEYAMQDKDTFLITFDGTLLRYYMKKLEKVRKTPFSGLPLFSIAAEPGKFRLREDEIVFFKNEESEISGYRWNSDTTLYRKVK